jgi:large subunit ribosomal protein L4
MSTIKVKTYNQKCEELGEEKLPKGVFGLELNESLVHQAMVAQMGNERQILAHTKDRSEVRGGGKKPWNQKGTGRARAGSNRSPIWMGGGVTFGPTKDRNFKKDINRKMRQKAINIVLSDKVKNNNFIILEKLELKDFKTSFINKMFLNFEKKGINNKNKKRSILLINDSKDEKLKYSTRNLEGVKLININNINILDLLKYRNLIVTKETVKKLVQK